MDEKQILEEIKTTETAEIGPDAVAEIFALTVANMSGYISQTDLRRLILLGAAMYRNSTKERHVNLQMPGSGTGSDPMDEDPDQPFLH